MTRFLRIAAFVLLSQNVVNGFTTPSFSIRKEQQTILSMSKNIVVISPPGGVGEVAAVEAAKLGSSVKWFVISSPSSSASSVSLSAHALESIAQNGGKVELAGAKADTLLLNSDDPSSAVSAVSTWCSQASGIICTVDGAEESNESMMDAIKVAAREACQTNAGTRKVVILPSSTEIEDVKEEEEKGGNFLGSILGGNKVTVPSSVRSAMSSGTGGSMGILRYGELFGSPESSSDSSPFVGGPRKYPVLKDEYTMKSIRIDPTISVSGNSMIGELSESSRLSVGKAAARMALEQIAFNNGIDVCLTSLRGMDEISNEEWAYEFERAQELVSSGEGAQLFTASFSSVPSIERLSDWIATKWAPAVMKTYDIAGIRVGARPVYASRTAPGEVEIIWQELKDFKPIVAGKMIIKVEETGITAIRGPGDASNGYGDISKVPLNGEDILVRRLSEAASQAIEKGLATKPVPKKREKKVVVEAPVQSTVVSSGSVAEPPVQSTLSDTGPRARGVRRSTERTRGKRKVEKKLDPSSGTWQ